MGEKKKEIETKNMVLYWPEDLETFESQYKKTLSPVKIGSWH